MRKVFLAIGVGFVLAAAGCRPAATPVPNLSVPTSDSHLPLPSPTAPQVVPENTREVPLSPESTPATASGIHLKATIGPTCPGPERPGQVCTRPYAGPFVVTDKTGAEAARANTDENGQATINLPPGEYTVAPKVEGRFPSGAPTNVTVPPGQYVAVSIELDTGIR